MKKYGLFMILLLSISIIGAPSFVSADGESWLMGWDYRRAITITGSAGAGTNYQVNLTVFETAEIEFDFADIRFTAKNGLTQLDYWLEWYEEVDAGGAGDDNIGYFWVNVTANLDTDQVIYMYYGNAGASTTSNGTDTFIVYEDWASESIRADVWDILDADGTVSYSSEDANHGKVAEFAPDNGDTYKITSDYDTASPVAIMFRSNTEDPSAGNGVRIGSGHDGAFAFALVNYEESGDKFYVYDDDANQDSQVMTGAYVDSWITFQITRDGTNTKLYADTILIETASMDPDIVVTNPVVSLKAWDDEDELYSDWVCARKFITTEPVFASWGDEETAPPRAWATVNDVDLIFPVGWHPVTQFSYDAFFIFLGLIMLPVSTMYLVKGGRKELSQEKLFYFLIIFIMGWGFFVGGIMP